VMHTVAFRPLKNKAEPVRRADIPVVNKFSQTAQQHSSGGGLRSDADDDGKEWRWTERCLRGLHWDVYRNWLMTSMRCGLWCIW